MCVRANDRFRCLHYVFEEKWAKFKNFWAHPVECWQLARQFPTRCDRGIKYGCRSDRRASFVNDTIRYDTVDLRALKS